MASFFAPLLKNAIPLKKDDLPPESLSEYYEERKKIIFKKLDIKTNEDILLKLLKKSQEIVNDKCKKCVNGGFFQSLASNVFNLSNSLKENIANYCLIFTLYFNAKENIKALQLFLLMCKQNENSINYLTSKIFEQLPKISNTNKIAKFYPTITKTMLQILSIFIKLSGRFHKPTLENLYIILYFKIVHVLSITVIKYIPSSNKEMNNQLKNERRYFYSSCLFDSSIYLFNRFQPLSTCIYILKHILDLYGNKLTFVPNEIESILLLKVNFDLGLFYYIDGYNNEAINNLNQARERLLDIKYFPITPAKFIKKIKDNNTFDNATNSSVNLFNFNEFLQDFNQNVKFNRNESKRISLNSNVFIRNYKNNINNKENLIAIIKEKNSKIQKEYESKNTIRIKKYSTIYLGANSLLNFENPILLEQVKEKILIEIELLLSEIELNHKNYKESLNHINTILTIQSMQLNDNNNNNNNNNNTNNNNNNIIKNNNAIEYNTIRKSTRITKSKTVMTLIKNAPSNGMSDCDENKNNDNKYIINLKNSLPSDSSKLLLMGKKKVENNNNNNNNSNINKIINKIKNLKYRLSNVDKNRIMLILEQIEWENNRNENNISDKKMQIKFSINFRRKKESLKIINKDRKMITSKEMEKFFLFLCGLSIYQLKILNESQPEPSQRRNDLPIIFSNQFQDCLTNAQRMSLSVLETMSLSRYIILKDTNKDICPENLDYRFMKYRIKETDSDEEYYNKINNKTVQLDNEKGIRRSSNDSNNSNNTQISNIGSQKYYFLKKGENETGNEIINFDLLLNIIKTEENKHFIELHKRSIINLLNQMSKEELKIFMKSPKLLIPLIDNISKDYEIKENGGNIYYI